jgi:predicted amidohydrolase
VSTQLRVALAQCDSDADHLALIADARTAGADVIVFPEMLSIGYSAYPRGDVAARTAWRASATDVDGEFVARFREAARREDMHVVTTLLERSVPDPFNTAVLIGRSGDILRIHRKIHICDFDAPEEACGSGTRAEVTLISTKTGPAMVGMMICMDREYADVAGMLSAAGAEVLLVPNCCDLGADPEVGDVRIAQTRGRAFEAVTGIAVANYPRPKADGHSFAVGPVGEVLAMGGEGPDLVIVDFDLSFIRRTREQDWYRWRDRRSVAAE